MAEFVVNAHRLDPYKNSRFQVVWDGKVIAGISHISGLRKITQVINFREGGDNNTSRKSPGSTNCESITLVRGRTHDTAFEDWSNLVSNPFGSPQAALASFRKDIQIRFMNEAGQVALVFILHRCWPSSYEPVSDLDANSEEVALEKLTLEYEGFQRDTSVQEPTEPA